MVHFVRKRLSGIRPSVETNTKAGAVRLARWRFLLPSSLAGDPTFVDSHSFHADLFWQQGRVSTFCSSRPVSYLRGRMA